MANNNAKIEDFLFGKIRFSSAHTLTHSMASTSGGGGTDRVCCCIVVCPNARPGANPTVGYHPFPADDAALRRLWIAFVGPAHQERFRWRGKYICSEHFQTAEVIARDDGRKTLLENSIPTIFTVDEDDNDEDEETDVKPLDLKLDPEAGEPAKDAATTPGEPSLPESEEVLEEEIIEVRSLFCRVCLGKHQSGMVPLSSRLREHRLVDMIYAVTGLKMKGEGSVVPNRICPDCVTKIDLAYNIREEFLQREKILRDMLGSGQLEQYYDTYAGSPVELPNQSYLSGLIADATVEVVKQSEQPDGEVLAMETIVSAPVAMVLPIEETIIEEIPISMEEEHLYVVDGDIFNIENDFTTTIGLTEEVQDEDDVDSEYTNAESICEVPVTERIEPAKVEEEKIGKPVGKVEPSMKGPPIQIAIIPETTKNQKLDQVPSTSGSVQSSSYLVRPSLMDPKSCHICFTHHSTQPALAAHLSSHAGMIPYKCQRCSTDGTSHEIDSVAALNEHVGRHQFPFQCGFCDKRFSGENALFEHMRVKHDGESTTTVTTPPTTTTTKEPAVQILQVPQSPTTTGGFTCTTCGQQFAKRALYRHHMTRHEALEDERFKCQDCGRVFGSALLLRLHRKIHTGEWKGFVSSRAVPYGILSRKQHHGKGG